MSGKHCEKRRNAHYEQFHISHSVFKRLEMQTCKNQGLFWNGLSNSTLLKCHFEIIKRFRPVLDLFPFSLFLSRSSDKVSCDGSFIQPKDDEHYITLFIYG